MKTFVVLLAALFLINTTSASAQVYVADTENTSQEILNIDLPEAKIHEASDRLSIDIGKNSVVIETPRSSDLIRIAFDSMSQEDKEAFQKKRRLFLSKAARALNMLKYGFGLGSIVKEKITYRIENYKDSLQMARMQGVHPGVYEDFLGARDRALQERDETRQQQSEVALKERSHQIISRLLKGLDTKLWQQAPLFTKSNEFGISASGGLELLMGKKEKGWGGILELGASLGYNSETRSLVFQLINNREGYKNSPMPVIFLTGAVGKLGTYISNQTPGEYNRQGISYYPPIAPAFSSMTKSSFTSGFSTGLTWPPSPLGDLLTYTDTLNQTILLRISISPLQKGFVHLKTGLNAGKIMVSISKIKDVIFGIGKKQNFTAPICAGLL